MCDLYNCNFFHHCSSPNKKDFLIHFYLFFVIFCSPLVPQFLLRGSILNVLYSMHSKMRQNCLFFDNFPHHLGWIDDFFITFSVYKSVCRRVEKGFLFLRNFLMYLGIFKKKIKLVVSYLLLCYLATHVHM